MPQRSLLPTEIQILQRSYKAEETNVDLRLREGEYHYSLAKAIATFQLELDFPDVKDIVRRLYGEEKTTDLLFIRKIQTILKKMEKMSIVEILHKREPWELQRYSIRSFRFLDSNKNSVSFASDQQIKEAVNMLHHIASRQKAKKRHYAKIGVLMFTTASSYIALSWSLMDRIINPIISISALTVSVVCSLVLGSVLSQDKL